MKTITVKSAHEGCDVSLPLTDMLFTANVVRAILGRPSGLDTHTFLVIDDEQPTNKEFYVGVYSCGMRRRR